MEELTNTRVERRPRLPKIYRIKKYVIGETTKINVSHLLRCLPFPNDQRICTIRKGALYNTLKADGCRVKKSDNLKKLMDIAKEHMVYDTAYEKTVKCIITIQTIFREYLANIEKRLHGPGIPIHRCVNDTCPYLLSELKDLPENEIITWKDKKIYGCSFVGLFGSMVQALNPGKSVLYDTSLKRYQSMIDEYSKLTRRQLNQRYSRNPFTKIRNPFTRNFLPGDLFHRALLLAKNKNFLKEGPRKRRIHEVVVEENISNEELMRICVNLAENMQGLEFYTPNESFTRIIGPMINFVENGDTNPVVLHAANTEILTYITSHIIPFYDYIREHIHNNELYRSINHDSGLRNTIRRFLPRQIIRNIQSFRSIQSLVPDVENPVTVISMNARLKIFIKDMLKTFSGITRLFNGALSTENRNIGIENKKSIAILLIIGLVNTNNLGGFEWARDM